MVGILIGILALLGGLFCVYALVVLALKQKSPHYRLVRSFIPNLILGVIIVYGVKSMIEYFSFINDGGTLGSLIKQDKTFTTIVNFATLLGFYQLLIDRTKDDLKIEQEQEDALEIPLSKFKVITYSEHKKIVKQAEKAVHDKYRNKK